MSELVQVAPERLGPPTFSDFLKESMLSVLISSQFGTYCHEGGDLVADTRDLLVESGMIQEDLQLLLDKEWDVGLEAERIITEYERQHCDFCMETEVKDDYDEDYEQGDR